MGSVAAVTGYARLRSLASDADVVERQLRSGREVEFVDCEGTRVWTHRLSPQEWALMWDDEPGWKGDAASVARMFAYAGDQDIRRRA